MTMYTKLAAVHLCLFLVLFTAVLASADYTTDKDAFLAANPNLMVQDFSSANISAGDSKTCPSPLNSSNNDQCFQPGDILPGLQIESGGPGFQNLRIIGSNYGALGNSLNSLIANNLDPYEILFFETNYNAVGLELGCAEVGLIPCSRTLRVDVFGFGTTIGSTTIDVTSAFDTFLGISADEPIARVSVSPADPLAKFVDGASVIYFGVAPRNVPTMSQWGLIALAGILGVIGFIVVIRKKMLQHNS